MNAFTDRAALRPVIAPASATLLAGDIERMSLRELHCLGWLRDALEALEKARGLTIRHGDALMDAMAARLGDEPEAWLCCMATAARLRGEIVERRMYARRLLTAAVLHEGGMDLIDTLDTAGLENPFGHRRLMLKPHQLPTLAELLP